MKKIISLMLFFCFILMFITSEISTANYCFALTEEFNNFTAKSYILMDYNSGEILYEKNILEKLPVASIIKLMTIELTCEEIESGALNLDDIVVVSVNASAMGGSQVFIEAGGEYSVGDLLKSVIVSSANDASVALAEKIAGSESSFVSLMNKKARELGLKNTYYCNSTGLPVSGQFSCAEDTAKLLKKVSSFEIYHKYSTIWMDNLSHPNGRESELVNTNKMIRYYEGCDGGKTGSTNEAGYCLSATAKRGNMRLICVVLGSITGKDRFDETAQLLNYGFANYENKKIVSADVVLSERAEVKAGNVENVSIYAKDDLFVLTKKRDDNVEIFTEIRFNSVTAPIKKGDKVGEIYVIKNGVVVATSDLVSNENVEKQSFFNLIEKIVNNWQVIN
ncbi:MAG: D-alanyl-D-alanine carboxypeptidase [Clostridia bacterium]|nr:D-alanyl-D-alanine carboxypeptidase [Clostridia bacterium]